MLAGKRRDSLLFSKLRDLSVREAILASKPCLIQNRSPLKCWDSTGSRTQLRFYATLDSADSAVLFDSI